MVSSILFRVGVDVVELVRKSDVAQLIGTVSLTQELYRRELERLRVPRGNHWDHTWWRNRCCYWTSARVRKLLDHISLTMWLVAQRQVCRLWLLSAAGRWVFDFPKRLPGFAALDHVWTDISSLHVWRQLKDDLVM